MSAPAAQEDEVDIMRLAQLGDETAIQPLLESGKFAANHADLEGITPLHWAAINNRYSVCKLLIDSGADVNAVGGESVATPAMWAAQEKHVEIVNLLLQHGADPMSTDGQGYNILHLATFNGNLLLIILLLHQGIRVDVQDAQGHTPLMWAAYKGFPHCVDLFLRWGADVHVVDEKHLTALHWALVKGNYLCIQKLVEYGSDRFAKNDSGKGPIQAAEEMDTLHTYQNALAECGYDREGRPKVYPSIIAVPETRASYMTKFFFLWPFFMEWIVFSLLASLPVYLGVPAFLGAGAAMHWVANRAVEWAPANQRALHKTPYLAGIFAGSCFWVSVRWIFVILPTTYASHPFTNFAFFAFFGLCIYFYAFSMTTDPGFVPKLNGREEQKEVVEKLLKLGKYDERNFCAVCMVRMPLRSKHCRRCGRCVAKHDHHCPWIFNCVGVNNHRQFFMYIISLEIGIFLLTALTYFYISTFDTPDKQECLVIPNSLCKPILVDPFTTVIVIWTVLQTTWVTMLLLVQTVQVLKGQTTYENMRGVNHGYDDHKYSNAVASVIAGGSTNLESLNLNPSGAGPDPVLDDHGHAPGGAHAHAHAHHRHARMGFWTKITKLLGVDVFVSTAREGVEGAGGRHRRRQNPFSKGFITNCSDFWCDSVSSLFKGSASGIAKLGGQDVDYFTMYDRPLKRRAAAGGGVQYQSVGAEDDV